MGLFSFIKDAGNKIFGTNKKKPTTKEANTNAKANAAAELLKEEEENAAFKLEETINDLQLKVDGLKVKIKGEMAIVKGIALDQTTKEKVVLVIGNNEGISVVDDQMTVENPEPEAQFHTVINGDTLGKIAKKYYGNPMKYPIIFEANQPMLTNPDKIYPGQVLRIPHLG
jgi:nucleoid-associated protein YgaU